MQVDAVPRVFIHSQAESCPDKPVISLPVQGRRLLNRTSFRSQEGGEMIECPRWDHRRYVGPFALVMDCRLGSLAVELCQQIRPGGGEAQIDRDGVARGEY